MRTPVPPAPMLATAGPVPNGIEWVFEPKWDGARLRIRADGEVVQLYSRNDNNLSAAFPEVCAAVGAALGGRRVILDGEIVALDSHARPDFQRLQRRLRVSRPTSSLRAALPSTVFVFDLLHLDGKDLTGLPYVQRRALLEQLRLDDRGRPHVVTSPAWPGDGQAVLDAVRSMNLEGCVAKRATSPYQPGRRSRLWVKHVIRQTTCVVAGGFIASGSREHAVGSLLVGGFTPAGDLICAGRIISGFSERERRRLYLALSGVGCAAPPFDFMDPRDYSAAVQWVRPLIVGRVQYRQFTGRLRHAAWKGMYVGADPLLAALPRADRQTGASVGSAAAPLPQP
jgi:bifunctional non-homologous end joining protein LigD